MQENFTWSGFIWSVTTTEYIESGTENALTVPCSLAIISIWRPGQHTPLPSCHLFPNIHLEWLTWVGGGSWMLHLLFECLLLSFWVCPFFTSLFKHCFIPVAYIITYTQMTCRSIISVGALSFCLCIFLPGIISITGCILIFCYEQKSQKGFYLILLFRLFVNTASLALLLQY